MDTAAEVATSFNFILHSIRNKHNRMKEERDEIARTLLSLDADLRVVKSQMKSTADEEQAKLADVNQQLEALASLRSKGANPAAGDK